MSKYEPLEAFLRAQQVAEVAMTFEEVERVVGSSLPITARSQRAFWSNNPSNNVMTRAWLAAGFKTSKVDMEGRTLVFRRDDSRPARRTPGAQIEPRPGFFDRIQATLAGTVTIPPGVDITEPTGEVWDAER